MREQTCCFSGHRDLSGEGREKLLRDSLVEVAMAIEEGYRHFISGFAGGADLIFAQDVVKCREKYPDIILEAAIPSQGRLKCADPEFKRLLPLCDRVTVLSEGYNPGVYSKRNRWMVDQSSRTIVAHDGRTSGGTYKTLLYARKQAIDIREIILP